MIALTDLFLKMENNMKTVLGIGAGYVGGPTMAVLAKKCPDYKFIVVDINKERIHGLYPASKNREH